MMRNNDKINIDLLQVLDTTEKNGVEVRIDNINLSDFKDKLFYLCYMPNLYLNFNNSSVAELFNTRKVSKHKYFNVCNAFSFPVSLSSSVHILLGNVLYYVNSKELHQYNSSEYREVLTAIHPKFDIGELDVTPNRESLLYSDKTRKTLISRIQQALEEVAMLYKQSIPDSFFDIITFFRYYAINRHHIDFGNGNVKHFYSPYFIHGTYLKYRNKSLSTEVISCINTLFYYRIPFIYVYKGGTFSSKTYTSAYCLRDLVGIQRYLSDKQRKIKIVILPSNIGTKSHYFKTFVNNMYQKERYDVILIVDKSQINIKEMLKSSYLKSLEQEVPRKTIVRLVYEIYAALKPYCDVIDIVNSKEYIDYKKAQTALIKSRTDKFAKPITFYYDYGSCIRQVNHKSVEEAVSHAKTYYPKSTYVICSRNDFRIPLLHEAFPDCRNTKKLVCISVAKTNSKHLKSFPEDFIPIEKFTESNHKYVSFLIKSYSSTLHAQELYNIKRKVDHLEPIAHYLPESLKKTVLEILNLQPQHYLFNSVKTALSVLPNTLTKDIYKESIDKVLKLKEILELDKVQRLLQNTKVNVIFMYICAKNKLIRPNYKYYKEAKQLINFNLKS